MIITVTGISKVVHEAVRAYSSIINDQWDTSQLAWTDTTEDYKARLAVQGGVSGSQSRR